MITDNLELEPLAGIYRGRFWPVTPAAVAELEAYVEAPLHESYVEFVTKYGSSRPATEMVIDTPDGSPVAFESFYGDPADHDASSVVKLAHQYPYLQMLTIGSAENGLFFMAAEGSILFQRSGTNEFVEMARSFNQFVERMRPDPSMD